MAIYSIRLDKMERRILAQLADERQVSRADVIRWLISEAGRVFLRIEPEPEENNYASTET